MNLQSQWLKKHSWLGTVVVEVVSCVCFRPDIHLGEVLKSCGAAELQMSGCLGSSPKEASHFRKLPLEFKPHAAALDAIYCFFHSTLDEGNNSASAYGVLILRLFRCVGSRYEQYL